MCTAFTNCPYVSSSFVSLIMYQISDPQPPANREICSAISVPNFWGHPPVMRRQGWVMFGRQEMQGFPWIAAASCPSQILAPFLRTGQSDTCEIPGCVLGKICKSVCSEGCLGGIEQERGSVFSYRLGSPTAFSQRVALNLTQHLIKMNLYHKIIQS